MTPSNKTGRVREENMQSSRVRRGAILLVAIFVLQSISCIINPEELHLIESEQSGQVEWVRFDLEEGVYNDAKGTLNTTVELEERDVFADSTLGVFNDYGLILDRPVPVEWMQARSDLMLLLVSNQINLLDARQMINEIEGLSIREYIYPSGLIIQGTPNALDEAQTLDIVSSFHSVPLAMLVEDEILDILLLEQGENSLLGSNLRIQGWRDDSGPLQMIHFIDRDQNILTQDIADIVELSLEDAIKWDEGRYEGILKTTELISLVQQPSLNSLRFNPQFTIDNNQAASHMKTNSMKIYFTSDLDGANQTVAVADSGLDDDHGDFGSRIVGNFDVINDGSTADKWSGHGTHVSCTVLGDGTRGGYTGVAPESNLYFQAMENDNTGNFQSPSLNSLLNSAYNAGARIHTNSWGSSGSNLFGKYTSESQDVDDRANYYDRYYNGAEGLVILFAAGNDGSDPDTVSPPATAKNVITVGMHQSRYSGAPDTIMSGSSRGPVDDGRIKPDILAPGGYVRSCKAQEASDTGGSSWSNSWYLEYTGTSMATPNAAGASAMIRQYLEEIALRDSPQGALVKALLILGAEDIGTRDIPNNDEGWGRINLRNSLAPPDGQGIWVDDRSLLSASGNSKSYYFDIDQANDDFKAVLTWSDEYASTSSNKQLVNNFDLEVTDPNGDVYLGNDFASGRSTTGGTADNTNNVEVVLIDSAIIGQWTVKIKDTFHGGSRSQPFSLAVMGHGINDLLPDLSVITSGYSIDIPVPSIGEEVHFISKIENTGNVKSDLFDVVLEVDGVVIETKNMDIGGGTQKSLYWTWTPQSSGSKLISFIIDPSNSIEETSETNNRHDLNVEVTTPGVSLVAEQRVQQLFDPDKTFSSWNVTITNTGLLPTNGSVSKQSVTMLETGLPISWYIGISSANFTLEGQESISFSVTMIHPETPAKGTYQIQLLGLDVDNGVNDAYDLELVVSDIANIILEYDYDIVPVSPIDATSLPLYLQNLGNSDIAYDLQVQTPIGWSAFFGEGSSAGQFFTTDAITVNDISTLNLTIQPPNIVQDSGIERIVTISIWSKTSPMRNWLYDIPIKVEEVKSVQYTLDSELNKVIPNSEFVMVFTIENKGNVDVRLYPSFIFPQGIQNLDGGYPFNLDIGESKVYLLTLYAGENAKSGQIQINLDNGSERFKWINQLEVQIFAKPNLEFINLAYQDTSTYQTYLGKGSHPSGEQLVFKWLVGNSADIAWTPKLSIQKDNALSVECNNLPVIEIDEKYDLICSVMIYANAIPSSEPSFTLELTGNGAQFSETVSLLVGSVEQVSWQGLSSNSFETGVEKQIQILVLNTGNIRFNHKLDIVSDGDWDVMVDGNQVIDLEIGESATVRFKITAQEPGFSSISLGFSTAIMPDNNLYSFNVSSEGESSGLASSGSDLLLTSLFGLIIMAIIILSTLLVRQRKQTPIMNFPNPALINPVSANRPMMAPKTIPQIAAPVITKTPVSPIPVQASNTAEEVEITQNAPPICWSCRNPVEGQVLGCPSCGARYHGSETESCGILQLDNCVSCSSPVTDFIEG